MTGPSSIQDEYDIVSHEETALSPEDLEEIRNWLKPTDYLAESGEFRRHLSSQAPGTGLWICETDEYKKWHDSSEHGSLWIKGVAGAGKSVIAASVVNHLRTSEDCPVLFMFFRNIVAANFSPRALIQDWLTQLLPYSPRLQFSLQSHIKTSLIETSDSELFQLFLDGLSSVPKCFCIADALDEMDEMTPGNRPLLDRLNSLATYRPHSLKLLITNADIAAYLHHRFDKFPKTDNAQEIKQKVIDMLTMDQVEAVFLAEGPVDISTLEETLPVGLEQTYTSLLAKQREENGINIDTQVFVLEAVTHSSRPLRLNELASLMKSVLVATCCAPLIEVFEDETLQVIHHSFTEFLRGEMRNLQNVDATIAFPIIESGKAHKHMSMNCEQSDNMTTESSVTYQKPRHLIDPDEEHHKRSHLGLKEEKDLFNYRKARLRHPFLSYAVENWSYHAGLYGDVEDEELFSTVLGFLSPDDIAFRRWLVLQWGSTLKRLHIAAFLGLSYLALKLIKEGLQVSTVDAQERTPLVSLLIQHGSVPNAEDGRGLKPIHLAVKHASVVKVLLEAGVEPDTIKTKENHAGLLLGGEKITKGECAILYASQGGYSETIITMIPFCKPETRTESVLTILETTDVSANATTANVKCVQALISRGADVTQTSKWAPRHTSWRDDNDPSCRAILRIENNTALLIAAGAPLRNSRASPRVSALKALLEAGADLNKTHVHGDTPMNLVLRLDQAGGDPNKKGHYGETVLHWTENTESIDDHGSTPVFQILLARCNDDAVKKRCWFGLSSQSGIERFTKYLELNATNDHDAKTDVVDNFVLCPQDRLEKRIATDGVDPLSTNHAGDTLLHHAADLLRWIIGGTTALHVYQKKLAYGSTIHSKERIDFIDVINNRGQVDFEIRDNDGLTALHLASMRSEKNLSLLIDAGADLTRMPSIVCQILQLKTIDFNKKDGFGEPESVAFLLRYGADIRASTLEQNIWDAYDQRYEWLRSPARDVFRPQSSSPKTRPCSRAIGTIVKMLLDANADIAAVDKSKLTALDAALLAGCAEFVEVFAKDEALFEKATKALDNDEGTAKRAEGIRRNMRAHMELLRPRSALANLHENKLVLDEVIRSPFTYLGLLTDEDAAQLINTGFETNQLESSYNQLLRELMKPGHTEVAEQVSRVILHYSSYTALRERIEIDRKVQGFYYDSQVRTALQLACQQSKSNMLTLQFLIGKLRVNVNAQGARISADCQDRTHNRDIIPTGTALHILASADHSWQLEGMRYLLSHGADVNALDEEERSALHIAACGKKYKNDNVQGFWRLDMVRILLDYGANPNILDKTGLSPLHKASAAPDIMKDLLRRGADPAIGNRNPMFLAIYDQNLSALETLLDHGLSVDLLDEKYPSRMVDYKLTEPRKVYALLCAAFAEQLNTSVENSVPLLQALVQRGANLYLPLNDNETLLHFLFEFPEYEVLNALLREPCVSRIDFNYRDQRGRTVLIASCDWREVLPGYSYRHWDPKTPGPPLRILDRGADATLADNEGKTALHHLLENPGIPDDVIIQFINREEVAPTLFLKDIHGFSPFHYALRILRPKVCELLLSKGASMDPDPNGFTVLHNIASQCLKTRRKPPGSGHIDIELPEDYFDQCLALWQRFIAAGFSINIADNAGNTPLFTYLLSEDKDQRMEHSRECHLHHYDKLFPPNSRVDIFAVNEEVETALHVIARREKTYYTREGHDKAMFEAFMAKGLDPLKEDAKGRSALDAASAFEKNDIIAIFGRK
ncbi:ankyrin repeat-containing domain protein [Daldinia decipiens]|uniref:ankyrin repeat-containing domain protein n=1 Tax=Daldinia decipiens TaxID=326647 RepID=UPI0020C2EBAF|nr:ankyrin repeat-containing domain protein [Daldinia decipiens]KAI1654378.1 ankyrin repeat-containing domain protein [Daldinia decipiens]